MPKQPKTATDYLPRDLAQVPRGSSTAALCIEAGRNARKAGFKESDCPYSPPFRALWRVGWYAEHKAQLANKRRK